MKTFCAAFIFVFLGLSAARADVSRITAEPETREISYPGRGAQGMTTSWRISRTRTGGPVELKSPEGKLLVNGAVRATLPARARQYSGNPDSVEFSETITIPEDVLLAVQNGGTIVFERQFTDSGRSFATGRQVVRVSWPPAQAAPPAANAASGAAPSPAPAQPPARQVLTLDSPGDGAIVTAETVFRWPPVIGAAAYQVQILGPNDRPVYWTSTPATQVVLREFVQKNADNRVTYRWRVAAHDAVGNITAASELRTFTVSKR